ncbi:MULTISPECIES: wax ester/triacylglycerol synthase family O-acyltransferase [unclassified Mycolicibacterium]|uniref:WS/DGAT/MGAT family O-acyltransferase n=1 Tax=unclassified Mycolicibacterium TaxID=2636767 RepID=UPI0012DC0DFE|nr:MULTISPECIES: wax ester/triacylglycerol synthase family O-acyltransferase [unclassified Mycolicibacterium]MUL81007.1 wax ester/triacylglycerol synthase family O-acyltransferase [Mycolicibacterium sp. CBMA 329]MUL86773.1 wax ester/triacylglycerol synthase family O-acyltransferase [Mycolicibacterium sp. CBMA 331]MUL98942.1 wax ester/triacylglycerol synthase family O-acyltransferase [Mycolicibacterium sp. CBMA 334]MUM28818.1 wax ester/triacylglycerol synthase family O-acyltransferase [Mycolicib
MVSRLSASDAAFFHLEDTATPMYVGTLSILRKPRAGLSYETLLETVEHRLPQIPRYRQKVREVRLGLARPVWVDDRDFDITYHIRRSALPSPGSDAQLHDLIARLGSRPLDGTRPLWEMYLVEGLTNNRIAIYTKTHQALVNGMTALEIGHVIVDRAQKPPEFGEDIWIPAREPSDRQLVLGAIGEWIARPTSQLAALRDTVTEVATSASELAAVGRRVADVARTVARGTAPSSPLNTTVSRNRRFSVGHHSLEDYRLVRARYNCDINDVVLAVVAGALRNWLLSRGEPVTPSTTVRAMAPMSVYPDAELDSSGPGQAISEVSPFLVDLPVGEANPVVRLSQIAHATESHSTAASLVDARTIVTLSGFAPPTLHAMGIRVATGFSARLFNLLITNVPGAQKQMYVAGTKLLETYAVPPLLQNQVLAIGVTSYDGMLYFGINADRDAMSDVDVLPSLLRESLEELLEAAK